MRSLWLSLVLAGFVIGQTPPASLSLTGPPTAPSGANVTLTVSLISGNGPAGVQWDMSGLPSSRGITTAVTGKTLTCTATRCLLNGTNATAIPDGPIASIVYPQTTTAVTTSLLGVLGATPAGTGENIAAPASSITVPIQSNCDINGDGKVDATDIGLILQQALAASIGQAPNIIDVIRVVIAANGGVCLR